MFIDIILHCNLLNWASEFLFKIKNWTFSFVTYPEGICQSKIIFQRDLLIELGIFPLKFASKHF